ncbi:MAG: replication initiator protein A [Eubacteriales bacterium]
MEHTNYVFYRLPKVLFTNEKLHQLSIEAKLLYTVMLDRLSLSIINQWKDKEGEVYIYFTIEHGCELLGKSYSKISKVMAELEALKLIVRKRQGQGKPSRIYVKTDMLQTPIIEAEPTNIADKIGDIQVSRDSSFTVQDLLETDTNKTNRNQNNTNKIESIHLSYENGIEEDTCLEDVIFKELLEEQTLPREYLYQEEKLRIAFQILTEHEIFVRNSKKNYDSQQDLSILNLLIQALCEMLTEKKPMQIKGYLVTVSQVYKKLITYLSFEHHHPSMYTFYTTVMDDYKTGAIHSEIKHHLGYMKACIWNVLLVGDISLQTKLLNHFGGQM